MRIITNVEFIDVAKDVYEIYHANDMEPLRCTRSSHGQEEVSCTSAMDLRKEVVEGKRYHFEDGRELILGLPEEVQKALWLDYNSQEATRYENGMLKSFSKVRERDIENLENLLSEARDLKWYQRVVKVFTGYKE